MTVCRMCAVIGTLFLAGVVPTRAQAPGAPAAPAGQATPATPTVAATAVPGVPAAVPVRVEVVIERYQGEKRLSRVPFTLFANATDPRDRPKPPTKLRVGVEVPIVTYQLPPDTKPGGSVGLPPATQYRPFGTNIDCSATTLENGRFKVTVSIDDSAPYSDQDKATQTSATNDARGVTPNPVFRSFRAANTLILRDGQSTQFSAWTDRFSGESVRLSVTLSVVK